MAKSRIEDCDAISIQVVASWVEICQGLKEIDIYDEGKV